MYAAFWKLKFRSLSEIGGWGIWRALKIVSKVPQGLEYWEVTHSARHFIFIASLEYLDLMAAPVSWASSSTLWAALKGKCLCKEDKCGKQASALTDQGDQQFHPPLLPQSKVPGDALLSKMSGAPQLFPSPF